MSLGSLQVSFPPVPIFCVVYRTGPASWQALTIDAKVISNSTAQNDGIHKDNDTTFDEMDSQLIK